MAKYTIKVNEQVHELEVESTTPLLWVLRDVLHLVGTKYGCGMSQCGACTIHVDGQAMRSCSIPISSIGDAHVTTIEGLSEDGNHPVQKAWKAYDVPQCGYCQSGQIMTAAALLSENASPTDEEIDRAMQGNLCRCGSYIKIKQAIKSASK